MMFMKKMINLNILFIVLVVSFYSCKKDYGNLNSPTVEDFLKDASKDQLNNLVSGTESAMRINLGLYLDDVGVLGREMYRFSNADPSFTTDLLGAADATLNSSSFYIVNAWTGKYRVVKNCNLLIDAANKSTFADAAEKKGYTGFAKTIKAYQLLLLLNLTGNNGIRVDVANPDQPGPVVNYEDGLTDIANLLDEAKTDLDGAVVSFPLSSGFASFDKSEGLIKFNRALAARVAVYRKQWEPALTALEESFFDLEGDFKTGVYHVFSTGSGDQINSAFFPQNQAGEVRVAHPSYATDIATGDDRINKATLREVSASYNGLNSNRDVWVYTSSTAPAAIIRNEELVLIYAEANIQAEHLPDAVTALNKIRDSHNLSPYAGAVTKAALIDEMLNQRRYSLFYEGHRWVDLRRYERLNTLSIDRPDDNIWSEFPLPATEQ